MMLRSSVARNLARGPRQALLATTASLREEMPVGPSPVPLAGQQMDYRFHLRPVNRDRTIEMYQAPQRSVQLRHFDYDEAHKYRVPIPNLKDERSPVTEANADPSLDADRDFRRDALPRVEGIFRMRNTIIRVIDPHGYEIIRRHGGYYSNKPGSVGIRQKIEYSTGLQLTLRVISEARGRYPGLRRVDVTTRGYSAARTGFIEGVCMSGLHVRSVGDATTLFRNPFRPRPPVHIRYKAGGHYFSAWKRHRQSIGYQISRFALFATPLTG